MTLFRKPAQPDLAVREICGNLTRSAAAVTAWYELPARVWAFRSDREREAWIVGAAGQYAALPGATLHLRRTTRPFPVGMWAANLLRRSSPADPAAEDTLVLHLQQAARHLDGVHPEQPVTYLGVTMPTVTPAGARLAALLRRRTAAAVDVAGQQIARAAAAALTPPVLGAEPATEDALAWLLLRSCALGLTPPDRHRGLYLDAAGLLDMTGRYQRIRARYGRQVVYVDTDTGQRAHVAALTVGRMDELDIPQRHEPWLHLADQAGFPVEISCRAVVVPPQVAAKALHHRLLMIRSQVRDYGDMDLPAPGETLRLAEHAAQAEDEAASGRPADATRVHGWHRLAVWGETAEQCEQRAAALVDLYEQSRIELLRSPEQAATLAEFMPGQPVNNSGHLRWQPAKLWAAAVPQAVAEVGDNRGDLIGHVSASRAPVMFDAHFPMEVRERSGLAVFVSEPGGGKSTLIGGIAALAGMRGVRTTILDPSGPLAALAAVPQLAGRVQVLHLAGAEAGTLAPYALVPDPGEGDYRDRAEWARAVDMARYERSALAIDLCIMLLPPQTVRHDPAAVDALRNAVAAVPAEETSTLDEVMGVLERRGQAGDVTSKNLAARLHEAARLPLANLLFGRPPADMAGTAAPVMVITLAGLRHPNLAVEREYWSLEEQLAVPLLHCAHLLAARRCYGGSMRARKLVALDEAHFMQAWPSGRAFLDRLARDTRKWNIAALVASQNPADILGLEVNNLVSSVFVGRIADDEQVAAEALRLLRITDTPDGRYGRLLAGLSASSPRSLDRLGFREFLMRDVDGRVQQIRVDLGWSGLLEHLDTTPDGGAR